MQTKPARTALTGVLYFYGRFLLAVREQMHSGPADAWLILQNVLNKSEPAEWVYTASVPCVTWPQNFRNYRKSLKAKFLYF